LNLFSYSVGQFHYKTDGFRENNDIEQSIYNGFVQAALTPTVNLQAEYRYRDIEHGDLSYDFDLESPDTTFRHDSIVKTFRAGLNIKPQRQSTILASFMLQEKNENEAYTIVEEIFGIPFDVPTEVGLEEDGWMGEVQYLFVSPAWDLIVGGGYYDFDTTTSITTTVFGSTTTVPEDFDNSYANGYIYSNIDFIKNVILTIGLSYDSMDDDQLEDKDSINPKFGLRWKMLASTTLRLAAFKVLKRSVIADQTLEPTQVAGFNQFFDDYNGAESIDYGIAVDHKFFETLSGGVEYFRRDIDFSIGGAGSDREEDWEENIYRGFLSWTPSKVIAVNLDYSYEDFERQPSPAYLGFAPLETLTHLAPLKISYFHSSGVFWKLISTYVNQKVTLYDSNGNSERDEFVTLDAAFGYRLPSRHGLLSAEVRNIFDQEFSYKGYDDRTPDRVAVPYFLPERTFIVRFSFSF